MASGAPRESPYDSLVTTLGRDTDPGSPGSKNPVLMSLAFEFSVTFCLPQVTLVLLFFFFLKRGFLLFMIFKLLSFKLLSRINDSAI